MDGFCRDSYRVVTDQYQYAAAHGRNASWTLLSVDSGRELKYQEAAGVPHGYIERSALSLSVTTRPNENGGAIKGVIRERRLGVHLNILNVANHRYYALLVAHFGMDSL